MLFPSKTKFKKSQKMRNRFKGIDNRYFMPKVGKFGLKILNTFRLTSRQIETIRKIIRRKMSSKIKEQVRLSVFPDLPVTSKSSGVRMGKGKGHLNFWCFPVISGRVLFEIGNIGSNINKYNALACLKKGAKKLPSKCKIIIN